MSLRATLHSQAVGANLKMKYLLIIILGFSLQKMRAQIVTQEKLDSICEYLKNDSELFISTIESSDKSILPDDVLFHYAELLVKNENYTKAETVYRMINDKSQDDLISLPDNTSNYWTCRVEQLKTETKRSLRDVLITNSKFNEALQLISEDEITFHDIHSSSGKCINPWIKSQQKIDSARCLFGLRDTNLALDILFFDSWFQQECFDAQDHLNALLESIDSSTVFSELREGFENPFCSTYTLGEKPNTTEIIVFRCEFFGDTVLTDYRISDFNECSSVSNSIIDSLIVLNKESYYYKQVIEKEKN